MLEQLLAKARSDESVFITEADAFFSQLPDATKLNLEVEQIDGSYREFVMDLPGVHDLDPQSLQFLDDYVCARIYNILSSLGGRRLLIRYDTKITWLGGIIASLDARFGIGQARKDRTGFGKCINVIDRMLEHLDADLSMSGGFRFVVNPPQPLSAHAANIPAQSARNAIDQFKDAGANLAGKILCGIDVGGTDIKVAAAADGKIVCFKEFDWFPAEFTESRQMIDPILLLVRLVRARLSLPGLQDTALRVQAEQDLAVAFDKNCLLSDMAERITRTELAIDSDLVLFDSIGLCFPDVVVKNKIVGGEVYKTRGIRNNPHVDYEVEFSKISDLDLALQPFCKPNGSVRMTNDGPMASFTAAVEQVFSDRPERVADGVFAHTLGTELGTGWIDESGSIPDIPLEVYNFIIDLGSYEARQYPCDDLRSTNNFNTGLAGTLQKYASQSGAFRLAIKYFEKGRPDIYQEMVDLGFIVARPVGMQTELIVPTEPIDLRKPFLQYLMDLVNRENDPLCDQIFIDIGKSLAVTWAETELILKPKAKSRVLFGRLVKNPKCFSLMQQGARELAMDLVFEVADGSIANTTLMKQLEADPEYTVAQFAQAIGAIYFGNVQEDGAVHAV